MPKSAFTLAVAALALTAALALGAQQKAAAKPAPAKPAAAPAKLGPGLYATFATSKGSFVAQLYPNLAPKSVQNFVDLAQGKRPYKDPRFGTLSMSKYYEGLLFFRTIPDFLLQTGDLLNNGQGNLGYTIPTESDKLKFDQPGRMALAQAPGDPNTRGAQVFFTLKPIPSLDSQGYVIIGQIVQGLDVATALSQGPRKGDARDIPAYPNVLNHVTIATIH